MVGWLTGYGAIDSDASPSALMRSAAAMIRSWRASLSVAHRGTRGRPSPNIAISSRCTSLTPPPKVSTRLRLAWASR